MTRTHARRIWSAVTVAALVVVAVLGGARAADAAAPKLAAKPYLGWSSWSLQSTHYPGVNPQGDYSWLTEDHVLAQARVMADKLKQHGYEYVNIDAGWWMDWGWNPHYDAYGRQLTDPVRFPDGIAYVADQVHRMGLKLGIYMPVGMEKGAYGGGDNPVYGTTDCHTRDVVYPDLRTTNGWDSAYKIDFSNPCAQKYIDSIASMFAGWGVDFLKLDGVGPGSNRFGANYDNRADVQAWHTALTGTGRPIQLLVSWTLDHDYVDAWRRYSNGWRVDTDVECYCDTLVSWDHSVKQRFDDVIPWLRDTGPGGWNNLDSLDVGVGSMDGLTDAERQTYMTLWAIEAAPLYSGDDLTRLDDYGLSLLTNDEVIAVDQQGRAAAPVNQYGDQQVWSVRNADGSYTVALFNLGSAPATATAQWGDVGFTGIASVRDLWRHEDLGDALGGFTATLPAHGSRLLKVTPGRHVAAPATPADVRAASVGSSSVTLAWHPSPGATAYDVYRGATRVATAAGPRATVTGLTDRTTYGFTVVARNASGNTSRDSAPVLVTTGSTAAGPNTYEAESPANVLVDGAGPAGCAACSGGQKIGNLGGNAGRLTFPAVRVAHGGDHTLTIAYVDGDAGRDAVVTVNGLPRTVHFPGTDDNDWSTPQTLTVTVPMHAGANTIEFGNKLGWSPDIDALTV